MKLKTLFFYVTKNDLARMTKMTPTQVAIQCEKGNKADFIGALKDSMGKEWLELEDLPSQELAKEGNTCMTVDMMAFVQRYEAMGSTDFSQLQKKYLEKILCMKPRECTIVHVVGDRYDISLEQSLKR